MLRRWSNTPIFFKFYIKSIIILVLGTVLPSYVFNIPMKDSNIINTLFEWLIAYKNILFM